MDEAMRRAVEERAYALWEADGRPEGGALSYWLRAERELGAGGEARDMRATLKASVGRTVPADERLPSAAAENPLSEHVAGIAEGAASGPGEGTFAGGDEVPEDTRGEGRRRR